MEHQIEIDEALAIAKEYHLEREVGDFATITNIYDYVYMQNMLIKLSNISFIAVILMLLNMINNTIQI